MFCWSSRGDVPGRIGIEHKGKFACPFCWFCAKEHGERFTVENCSSGIKRRHSASTNEVLLPEKGWSSVPRHSGGTHDAEALQEFAVLTQGRTWTLLYQSGPFTAQALPSCEKCGGGFLSVPGCLLSKTNHNSLGDLLHYLQYEAHLKAFFFLPRTDSAPYNPECLIYGFILLHSTLLMCLVRCHCKYAIVANL